MIKDSPTDTKIFPLCRNLKSSTSGFEDNPFLLTLSSALPIAAMSLNTNHGPDPVTPDPN